MKKALILTTGILGLVLGSCEIEGCTDPLAANYNKRADVDDGSCVYPEGVTKEITENITIPTTIGDETVRVCGDIHVSAALTIQPGAILVMCEGASLTIEQSASINATGTAEKPIVMKGEIQTTGYWEGIDIRSNNPNNKFIYTSISDAGSYWGWEYANVFLNSGAKLEMSHSMISNSQDVGLYVTNDASLVNFSSNTFSSCITGLSVGASQVKSLDGASDYSTTCTNNFIMVRSGTITTDATWAATATPYLLEGVYLEAGLTVSAGAVLLMEADSYLEVKSTGFLKSQGTQSNPVTIKGRYASAGYWGGISVKSTNPNNQFNYTVISDGGGYWGYEYANIYVTGSLKIDDCTVSNANSWGLYKTNSSSIMCDGVAQTVSSGVESANTFTGNGSGSNAACTGGCGVYFE